MDYLIARLARIYPIFGLSILLSLPFFVGSLMHISSPYTHLLAASAILFAPLGLHAWVPGAACALNCPSWSISTEFFFYLLFPFILWRILRRPVAWSVATAIYLLLTWILLERLWSLYGQGFSLTGHSAHDHASTNLVSQFIMYFPPNRLPEFMSGVLLFVLWSMGGRYCKNVPLLVSAFLLASFVVFAFRDVVPDVALSNGFTAIAWAPLILAGASMRSGLLSWPPLIFLGRISFSLYMLHIPAGQIVVSVDKYLLGGVVSSFPLLMLLCKLLLAGLMSAAASLLGRRAWTSLHKTTLESISERARCGAAVTKALGHVHCRRLIGEFRGAIVIESLCKVVPPVAGLGTRFLPVTKTTAKEMLPVVDKSLIQYAIEEARGAGGEVQLTDGMAKLIGNQPFHGLRYEGRRFDCGDKIGFLEAQIAYALKRPELEDAVRAFLRHYVEAPDFLVNAVSRETV